MISYASALAGCKDALAAHGFTVVRSGAYDVTSSAPVQVMVESPPGERHLVNLVLLVGGPGAAWERGGLTSHAFLVRQVEQPPDAEPRGYYDTRVTSEVERFADDFERYTVPFVDLRHDPTAYVAGLLDGRIAPSGGRTEDRIDLADALLGLAAEFGLDGARSRAMQILEEERARSAEQREAVEFFATVRGLALP
ncbi:hypothetical protein [Cellulomonas sp.]|uniref:hypothetical protein n=1 Tax=Cellulomonas sp. TaxID=40001 RepID=UPI001B01F8D4|nr:hypothetical protein [Cellulomonas sp.]MBO9554557.1 hypothetical protein [Cellulomonas sp.]